MTIPSLMEPCTPYILEQSPAVLSVGLKCMEQGYDFLWFANQKPLLVRPGGKVIELRIDGHVPMLDDSCIAYSKRHYKRLKKVRMQYAMPGSVPRPESDYEPESPVERQGVDEGESDGEESIVVRSRKVEDLIREAQSAEHQFVHYPKNPFCRVCQRAKMLAPQARKKAANLGLKLSVLGVISLLITPS